MGENPSLSFAMQYEVVGRILFPFLHYLVPFVIFLAGSIFKFGKIQTVTILLTAKGIRLIVYEVCRCDYNQR